LTTPTKAEIIARAKELYHKREAKAGNPAFDIEPELCELKEEGYLSLAKSELMSGNRPYEIQWENYVNTEKATAENKRVHSGFTLSEIINDIKEHLGIVICAEAGHGKSFTAFTLAKEAMKDPNMTVIILSPSTVWRRKFGAIKFVKVGTSVFNPIVSVEEASVESVPWLRNTVHVNLDKKWSYVKSRWFEDLLSSKQHLLFEIKYKNGRRIKAFESVVLQYIYEMQEREIDRNPEYAHHYLIILEEIQNSFGTYSMNSDDSLDLMTIFTQSRSDANIHYVGIGQRLNDISTKVIERLRPMIGLTLGDNSLRKIKSQLPQQLKDSVQQLPKRHWIYLDGKENPEIEIAEYKAEGLPIQLMPFEAPMTELVLKSPSFFKKLKASLSKDTTKGFDYTVKRIE